MEFSNTVQDWSTTTKNQMGRCVSEGCTTTAGDEDGGEDLKIGMNGGVL
jgi:hypothetical protein